MVLEAFFCSFIFYPSTTRPPIFLPGLYIKLCSLVTFFKVVNWCESILVWSIPSAVLSLSSGQVLCSMFCLPSGKFVYSYKSETIWRYVRRLNEILMLTTRHGVLIWNFPCFCWAINFHACYYDMGLCSTAFWTRFTVLINSGFGIGCGTWFVL